MTTTIRAVASGGVTPSPTKVRKATASRQGISSVYPKLLRKIYVYPTTLRPRRKL